MKVNRRNTIAASRASARLLEINPSVYHREFIVGDPRPPVLKRAKQRRAVAAKPGPATASYRERPPSHGGNNAASIPRARPARAGGDAARSQFLLRRPGDRCCRRDYGGSADSSGWSRETPSPPASRRIRVLSRADEVRTPSRAQSDDHADPARHVTVAQAARAVLQVGLKMKNRVAEALMPRAASSPTDAAAARRIRAQLTAAGLLPCRRSNRFRRRPGSGSPAATA